MIELKSLESDPEYKIHEEIKRHEEREEYPLFYGEWDLQKVLNFLSDGEQIREKQPIPMLFGAKKRFVVRNDEFTAVP